MNATTITYKDHEITVHPMQRMDIHLNPKNGFSALIIYDGKQVKRLWATTAEEAEGKAKEYIDTPSETEST